MNKDLVAIFEYLEKEKGIKREVVMGAIEEALKAAARKNVAGAANVSVSIHPKTGVIDVYCEKEIVEIPELSSQEISLEEARKIDPDCSLGQFIDVMVTPKDFGRIAAQTARQVIAQKLREAEKEVIYEEFRYRIHDLVSGTVKKIVRGANLIVDLKRVEALLPMREYPKTEKYQVGDRVLALLLEVRETEAGGAEVILSRSSPDFVKELLKQEVPEIGDGTVVIDRIVRDAGYRTKIAVHSTDPKVDPVGACVGMRGNRVKNVIRELNNEKIDLIVYTADPIELLEHALAPIEIRKINVEAAEKIVSIVVDDEHFAAVIGKRGMNARLNGQLIGHQLEVHKMSDYLRVSALGREELVSHLGNPALEAPLQPLEGVSALVFTCLKERYPTLRDLLLASPEELSLVPGVNHELLDKISEQIKQQRN